ncbi:MAG: reverse transcriptase/maturase family protein [Bacteroidota bacterium]
MKRKGQVFEKVYSFEHLLTSFQKAKKGATQNQELHQFYFELEPRLLRLSESLMNGAYQPAPYRYFTLRDPKRREIAVAPFVDRVVHHAVVGILEPIFDPSFIYDSYATRKGKGTHAALERSQHFLKKYRWFFKTDIDQYFASIHHNTLLKLITRKIKDHRLMELIEKIIRNGGKEGYGLPIGNLTSQFFANVYLNPFDHFVKEELRIKGYLRYMDDFVLFSHEKEGLKSDIIAIENYLKEQVQLRLKSTNSFLNQRSNGLSFLGARVFTQQIRIHRTNLKRSKKKLIEKRLAYQNGNISQEKYVESLQSRWAYLNWFDSHSIRRDWAEDTFDPDL